jgi:hypothetical protein
MLRSHRATRRAGGHEEGGSVIGDFVDDGFTPEPNAWDLAVGLGIRSPPSTDPAALDELADAMLVGMSDGPELDALTTAAVAAIWSSELEAAIREGLEGFTGEAWWTRAAHHALGDLAERGRGPEVAHEVVRHLAMDLGHADVPPLFCLHCLEEWVAAAPDAKARRELAIEAALVAATDVDVDRRAAVRVLARPGGTASLGTVERRAAVRARLRRIANLGRRSIPRLAAELDAIAGEPLPAAEDDDVWEVVCRRLVEHPAAPGLN